MVVVKVKEPFKVKYLDELLQWWRHPHQHFGIKVSSRSVCPMLCCCNGTGKYLSHDMFLQLDR